MLISAKLAPIFSYGKLERFWRLAGDQVLTGHCNAIGRAPSAVRRSVQLFLHPAQQDQMTEALDMLPAYQAAGCQHAVLSFYEPPTARQLATAAP